MNEPSTNSPEDLGWTPQATGREPLRFPIPPSSPVKECRTCKAPIHWITTPAGKRMPVDPTGISHFSTCAQADAHRKPRAKTPPPAPLTELTSEQFFTLRGIAQGRQPVRRWPILFAADELLRAKLVMRDALTSRFAITEAGRAALAADRRSR